MAFLGNAMVLQGRNADGLTWLSTAAAIAPDLATTWLGMARAYLALGQPADAIDPLRRTIRLEPEDTSSRLRLARALREVGRLDEAHEVAAEAGRREPDAYLPRLLEGSIAFELERYEEAIPALEAAVRARPEAVEAARGLAAALVADGREQDAVALLTAMVERHPDDVRALVNYGDLLSGYPGSFEAMVSAGQAYRRALAENPTDTELARKLVNVYLALEMASEGIDLIDSLPTAAEDADLTLTRGRLLTRLQRYADALETYDRAIALGAGAIGWYYRGVAETNLGDLDAAVEAFRKAIEIDPEMGAGYRDLGKVLSDRSRYEEALEVLRTATSMLPEDATAHYLAGAAALRAGRADEALPLLDEATRLDPADSQSVYNRAIALRQLGRAEESQEAMQRFQELRAEEPNVGAGGENRSDRAQAVFRQGIARFRLVGPAAALPYMEQAIELAPDYAVAHYTSGLCYGYAGEWDLAAAAFERTVELDPERPDGFAALAEAYGRLGRTEEAEAMRATALELLARLEQQ